MAQAFHWPSHSTPALCCQGAQSSSLSPTIGTYAARLRYRALEQLIPHGQIAAALCTPCIDLAHNHNAVSPQGFQRAQDERCAFRLLIR